MLSALSIVALLSVVGTGLAQGSENPTPGWIDLPVTLFHGTAGEGQVYLVNISIGNPPQEVTVQVDTGSSDLLILAKDIDCKITGGCLGGGYDPSLSSTFSEEYPGLYNWSYGSGSSGTGDWVRDSVKVGGVTVDNIRIGLAKTAVGDWPLFGILGLSTPHASDTESDSIPVAPNVPLELARQGHIDTAAFSLYLNDLHSDGSIIFGGIDQAKYDGDIGEVNVIPYSDGGYGVWYIDLVTVGMSDSTGTNWYGNGTATGSAFIDSGAPKAFLPANAVFPIIYNSGAQWDPDLTMTIIPCSVADSADAQTTFVEFVVNGVKGEVVVRVPLAELIDPFPNPNPPTINGELACSFAISPGPDGFMVLGDGFLRGAYAVFNMDKHTVGLANVKLNATDSNIVPVAQN